MDTLGFIKLLIYKAKYILLIPLVTGLVIFFLTRGQLQSYASKAVIFTGITSNSSIEDMERSNVDYFATQNAYNNVLSILNSRSVLEETSLRLLTMHLMTEGPDPRIISKDSYSELVEIVPEEVRSLIVKGDMEQSYQRIAASVTQDEDNFLYGLLNYDHPSYSIKALSTIKAVRIQSSDLVEVTYENSDPAICYKTLDILTNVFIDRYNQLQKTQTSSIVGYFEMQLKDASDKLRDSENKLLAFNTENDIINYYEQTKHISSQEEKIEVKLQDMKLELDAATSVLARIESEINNRFAVNLKNVSIMNLREQLVDINDLLALEMLREEQGSVDKVEALKQERLRLEEQLQQSIDTLYVHENRSDGIEQEEILGEWLEAVKENESARARFRAMEIRKVEFMERYQQYAPLGATLKRIEREIDVNEREYLEILHHLGLARLKQQNADLMSNMKVLDAPKLPINPLPSKRKVFVVVFAIAALLFYLFGLFLSELFDQRVRTPEKMEYISELSVVSALVEPEALDVNTGMLNKRAANYLLQELSMHLDSIDEDMLRVNILSNWEDDFRSDVLQSIYHGVMDENGDAEDHSGELSKLTEVAPGIRQLAINFRGKQIMLQEVSALSEGLKDPAAVRDADLQFFAVNAQRVWGKADDVYLERLKEISRDKVKVVLTKTIPRDLENFYGEIPKKRSGIRKFFKTRLLARFI